jgi:selenocysteine lyase/cysteine desulfurase
MHLLVLVVAATAAALGHAQHEQSIQRFPIKDPFLLNYTNFNHGSFGACPKSVLEYQFKLRTQMEQQPDPFIRQTYKQLWNETRVKVADSFNVPYPQLVLLESASTAVNSILRSMSYQQDDIILFFSTAYGMVKNTCAWLKQQYNLTVMEIPISFPVWGPGDYLVPLDQYLQQLQKDNTIHKLKVAIFDHIVSIPAIKLPVMEMTHLVRKYTQSQQHHPFILVDGAHAWGQVPNEEISALLQSSMDNLRDNDTPSVWIDAYLSNGHKWMYSPKGSAILWVHPSRISPSFPEPTVISSENSSGGIENLDPLYHRFIYTSTKDYTAMLSIHAATEFRQAVLGGDDTIHQYVHNLALTAKRHLMDVWQVYTYLTPDSMEEYMINVILPIDMDNEHKTEIGMALQQWLYDKKNMYVVIALDHTSGYMYTRLSAQVYLEISDFERLGAAVLEFLKGTKCHMDIPMDDEEKQKCELASRQT